MPTKTKIAKTKRRRCDVSFLISAHQPYVLGYEAWPHGTDWLCAAVADQYIPLLNLLSRLIKEGLKPSIGVHLGPLLCEMLAELEFAPMFQAYIQSRIDAAAANQADFAAQGLCEQRDLAIFWQNRDTNIARDFDGPYGGDLVGAFRDLQNEGYIELLAGPVTGDHLADLADPRATRDQIAQGIDSYKKHFARPPRGMMLRADTFSGARAYAASVTELLAAEQVDYTVLIGGGPAAVPPLQTYRSIVPVSWERLPAAPLVGCVAAPNTLSIEVAEAASFFDPSLRYYPGGRPYWQRGPTDTDPAGKQLYDPVKVPETCEALAAQFVVSLSETVSESANPIVMALEFPGPTVNGNWQEWNRWFYRVLKKTAAHKSLRLTTAESLAASITPQGRTALPALAAPARPRHRKTQESWTWKRIAECQEIQARLIGKHGATRNPKLRQILQQCERELLLLQARDWPALIDDAATRDYAVTRFARHHDDFQRLAALTDKIAAGRFLSEGERTYVANLAQRDRCFTDISFQHWKK